MTRTYLVEDDDEFGAAFAAYLDDHGVAVHRLGSVAALQKFLAGHTLGEDDLILLDLNLHGESTLDYIRQLTAAGASCIVLTGNPDQTSRIIGLELGADDYISKTMPAREILARIRAGLRRGLRRVTLPDRGWLDTDWKIDETKWEVRSPRGEIIALTTHEFKLLRTLALSQGQQVSRADLGRAVFAREVEEYGRAVDNLVSRIRKKFRPFVGNVEIIRSVRLEGYVFLGFPAPAEPHHSRDDSPVSG